MLLPCGWLWVYVATAAGTGSVTSALLVMSAFWLSTVPMMAASRTRGAGALGPLRRHLPDLHAVTLVVLGLDDRRTLPPFARRARCAECDRAGRMSVADTPGVSVKEAVLCTHCGLDVPDVLADESRRSAARLPHGVHRAAK